MIISSALALFAVFSMFCVVSALFGDEDAQDYLKKNAWDDTFVGKILGCCGVIFGILTFFLMAVGLLVVMLQ